METQSLQVFENEPIYCLVNYEDNYVQPKLLKALRRLSNFRLIHSVTEVPKHGKLVQWSAYEQIDFEHLLANPNSTLSCSYIIRFSPPLLLQ